MKMQALVVGVSVVTLAALGLGCGDSGTGGTGGTGASSSSASSMSTASTGTGTGTGTSSAGTGTSTSTSSTGSGMNFGDCATNADCPPNGTCVEVAPGGFRLCQFPVAEATMCDSPNDACCTSADCMMPDKCYAGPLMPSCQGIQPAPKNVCASDTCLSSVDCEGKAACMPQGTVGNAVAGCLPAACLHDTDCVAHAGGICATVKEPCCGTVAGLFCVYPTISCRTSNDCPGGYCGFDMNNEPVCMPGLPLCPA
jgi:hypothetical protein